MWLLFLRQQSFFIIKENFNPPRCTVISHLTQFTNIYCLLYRSILVVRRCYAMLFWKMFICETDLYCGHYLYFSKVPSLQKYKHNKTILSQTIFNFPWTILKKKKKLTTPISLSTAFVDPFLSVWLTQRKQCSGSPYPYGTQLNLLTFCSKSI